MQLNRRNLLRSFVYAGIGAAALPATARAESLFDMFAGKSSATIDVDGNIAFAESLIATPEPILSFDTAYNLQAAIAQYEPFVQRGGWEIVPQEVYGLKLGMDRRSSTMNLKRRLMASGDMPAAPSIDDTFDEVVDRGLRSFQARHGLLVNGTVDEATYYALTIPAEVRLNQLHLNLQRVNNMAASLSSRYVVVNIPAATIEAVEGGTVVQRHIAVVGRVDRATPIMASKIHQINFNPYWHVPKSLIERDLTKYMQEDPEYLAKQRIHIYDAKGAEISPTTIDWTNPGKAVQYMFRQEPGAENSMGHCKINFYNKHDCYLHDTPTKQLFGENARFHSSGCVRVNGVNELVAWLLRDNGGWDLPTVDNTFASNERKDVEITSPVEIHTTYISAWANRQGTVSFRDDVYEFDAQGKTTFEA